MHKSEQSPVRAKKENRHHHHHHYPYYYYDKVIYIITGIKTVLGSADVGVVWNQA